MNEYLIMFILTKKFVFRLFLKFYNQNMFVRLLSITKVIVDNRNYDFDRKMSYQRHYYVFPSI